MTSMPASRSARATIFAPRSCPSSPGFATTTRILRSTPPILWKWRAGPLGSALHLRVYLPAERVISFQLILERLDRGCVAAGDRVVHELDHLPRIERVVDAGTRCVEQRSDRLAAERVDSAAALGERLQEREAGRERADVEDGVERVRRLVDRPGCQVLGLLPVPRRQPLAPDLLVARIGEGAGDGLAGGDVEGRRRGRDVAAAA